MRRLFICSALCVCMVTVAQAATDPRIVEYEQKLTEWKQAHDPYEVRVDAYWRAMREARARGEYVHEHPPKYDGPKKPVHPTAPAPVVRSTIPAKDVFIAAARSEYGFTPEQSAEREFKKSYARQALKVGLTAEQVVKVYALETGGNGGYDDQPMWADGRPISTALGYVQMLNANTVIALATYGIRIAAELEAEGRHAKAMVVRRMARDASPAGVGWDSLQGFAKTPKGRAMHAVNLDVHIGPRLQMQALKDTVDAAKEGGWQNPTPAQIELLNLAGEKNGLLMLKPELKAFPAANFFTRDGYEANPVTHQRTGEQLLAQIDRLMNLWIARAGSQELLAAFEAAARN